MHYKNKDKIQCTQCPYYGKEIEKHSIEHHDPNLPYGCDFCGFRALTDHSVKIHFVKVHKEKQFKCNLGCGKTFDNSWYAKRHEERFCKNLSSEEREKWAQIEIESGRAALQRKRQQVRKSKMRKKYVELNIKDTDSNNYTPCPTCGEMFHLKHIKRHLCAMA